MLYIILGIVIIILCIQMIQNKFKFTMFEGFKDTKVLNEAQSIISNEPISNQSMTSNQPMTYDEPVQSIDQEVRQIVEKTNNYISKNKQKKGLICYYGGAFREGHSGNSNQDTEKGFDSQFYSTQSHIKLTSLMKKKGYAIDTIINTYHSTYEKDLKKWYNPYEILFDKINKNIRSTDGRDNLIQASIKNINNMTPNDYDFILFIRIDLFLKPDFFKVLNLQSERIQFLAHNFYQHHCGFTKERDPEVVDLILFVPKKYFYILDNKFKLNHNVWSYYKKQYNLTDDDMSFMTDLRFDSNTYLDYNPYYIISGRPENKIVHNYEKTNPNIYGKIGNKRGKDCPPYIKNKQDEYLANPAEYHYRINKDFYVNI
jgi:hypothetical protein